MYVTGALRDRVPSVANRVASEIVMNHNKQLPLEFLVPEFSDLCTAMSKLGFTPFRPQRLTDTHYELVGARYCSIGGSNAALIRLKDDAGHVLTLYEFRMDNPTRESRRILNFDACPCGCYSRWISVGSPNC